MSRRGFSLPELIVALAVACIVILMGHHISQRALEVSRTVQCAHNLRQIGIDIRAYVADHGNHLPWLETNKGLSGMWWYRVYGDTNFRDFSKRMACPSDPAPYRYRYPSAAHNLQGTYRYNKYLGYIRQLGDGSLSTVYPPRNFMTIGRQASMPMLADYHNRQASASDDTMGFETWEPILGRHQKGSVSNVLCVDGHIEVVKSGASGLSMSGRE